jgi:uncharacterized membrane protein
MKTNRKALILVLVALAVTLASISAFAFIYGAITIAASPSATASGTNGFYANWMSGYMMDNMMGGHGGQTYSTPTPIATTTQDSILPLIGLAALIGAALTGTGGTVYYFVSRPKITLAQPQYAVNTVISTPSVKVETPYDSVSKTLTADERKVIDILTSHNGEYLQKYIRAETGLSRLKIHRIVTRLAERGIVTLEQSGNTNKVTLSSWLAKQPFTKIKTQENTINKMVIEA